MNTNKNWSITDGSKQTFKNIYVTEIKVYKSLVTPLSSEEI